MCYPFKAFRRTDEGDLAFFECLETPERRLRKDMAGKDSSLPVHVVSSVIQLALFPAFLIYTRLGSTA